MPSSPLCEWRPMSSETSVHRENWLHQNDNPLRRDHRSPLEIIELGDIELLMLDQYAMDQTISRLLESRLTWWRPNISTGGDSIDVTDSMRTHLIRNWHGKGYGSWACGCWSHHPWQPAISIKENPNCTCIELNFNPSMYMHTYCAEAGTKSITRKY